MQHIPDNEFDQLFKDKFIDAEIEPSANLWANIENQLAPKPKRIIPIYWMAAATIAIAFTAMLVFQKTDKIQLRAEVTTASATKPSEQGSVTTEVMDEVPVVQAVNEQPVRTAALKVQNVAFENNVKDIEKDLQPNETIARLPIKQAEVKPIDVLPKELPLIENTPIVIAQVSPQQAAESAESNVIDEIDNNTERKGIRNIGDLVNFVVDKVDKREKKFLKFNTDDDDNSSLIGINIGFVKLNKKHK